jgi:hypothetical protein
MRNYLALCFVCLFTQSVLAETPYIDDRSSPERVVESLYSAINLKQFARAWSYFGAPPAKSYEAFVEGYKDTSRVDILVGAASSDGAAGTFYHDVPIAMKAVDNSGAEKFFAGCYSLSQTNPWVAEPPFEGLRINKGALKPSTAQNLADALPPSCGNGQKASADQLLLAQVKQRFISEQAFSCSNVERVRAGEQEPAVFQIYWKRDGAAATEPDNLTTLFMFECELAAYNKIDVYYTYNNIHGLTLVSFAEPDTDFKYEDVESGILKSWALRGHTTTHLLVNSGYEESTQSISMGAKWRGVGDASSSGTWVFRNGSFTLQDYEVDPTYDGEINPISIYKDGVPVALRSP